MAEIIDIASRFSKEKDKEYDYSQSNHNYVLDACEDVFDYGAVVLALSQEGIVEVSSTVEDEEEVVDMLVSAALSIQSRLDNNDKMD